jgi:hypothetical protein
MVNESLNLDHFPAMKLVILSYECKYSLAFN